MARHKLRSNKIKDGGSHVVAEQQLRGNQIKDGGSNVVAEQLIRSNKILCDIAEHQLSSNKIKDGGSSLLCEKPEEKQSPRWRLLHVVAVTNLCTHFAVACHVPTPIKGGI